MNREDRELIIVVLMFGLIISLFGYLTIYSSHQVSWQDKIIGDLKEELNNYFELQRGIIESPSVIIIANNYESFYNKCFELNVDTIYVYYGSFYVFESGYMRAWKYTPEFEPIKWGLLNLLPEFRRAN